MFNIIFWPYRPQIIFLKPENIENKNVIIIAPKQAQKFYEQLGLVTTQVYYVDEYNHFNITKLVKELASQLQINNIIGLNEFDIELAGMLNELYATNSSPQAFNSYLFRDKYMMRTLLEGVVKQPQFVSVNSAQEVHDFYKLQNGKPIILKPRNGLAAMGVKIIRSTQDIDSYPHSFNNCICEEFVNIKKMITADGIYANKKLHAIYFHEYSSAIAEALENKHNAHLVSTYSGYNNAEHIVNLSKQVEQILSLSRKNEIFPFHMELFITEDNEIVFCECAIRFGGAKIPELIDLAHNTQVFNEYWGLILGEKSKQNFINKTSVTLEESSKENYISVAQQPHKIATTYMGNRKPGKVIAVPDLEEFSFTDEIAILAKVGDEYKENNSAVQQLLIAVVSGFTQEQVNDKIKQLDELYQKFIIE